MKHAAIVQDYESRMTITGADEVARGFGKVEESVLGAADGLEVLVKQEETAEKAITRLGARASSYINQQLTPMEKQLKKVEYGERLYAAAVREGIENANALGAAVEKERAKYLALNAALNDNAKTMGESMQKATAMTAIMSKAGGMSDPTAMTRRMSQSANDAAKAAGLARHEWINLSRQGQDVAVSLAGGSSPLTVLMQQGGQIADVFTSSSGGAGAALKEFGAVIGRYALNPVTAIAAAIGTASYAMYRWQAQTDSLSISLNGLGRASGFAVGDVNQIASRAAAASGMSVSSARGLAGQYLGAGVSGGSIGGAIGLTRDFSRKLGMGEDDVAKILANALVEPARGADELARKFGLVSFAQREEINRLADLGDRSAATAKLIDVVKESLKRLEDPTWSASRALDELKVSASNFLDRIARGILGTGVSDDEFARQARQKALTAGKLDEALARQLGIDRIASDAALAAKEITAQTYAQREAIILEKGRTQALQDTKNATQHLMEAEAERLRLLAEAQRKVDDYTRAGARDRALSSARTPYERGRLQIIQEGEDLLRQIPSSMRLPQRATSPNSLGRGSSGTGDLLAEATRRGLEPTEQNFQKLLDEGVGTGKFRGRLVRLGEDFAQSTVDVPNINRSALERQTRAEAAARLQDYTRGQQADFFLRGNQDVEAQSRLLDANVESFGKSTGEVERAKRAAELLNQARQQGLPITDEMNLKIAEEAARYGDLATRMEEVSRSQRDVIDSLDIARSTAKDFGESLVNAFRRGESAAEAMRGVLDRLTSKMLDKTLDAAVTGLMGAGGTAQTGFLGSILGGLFSGLPKFAEGGTLGAGKWGIAGEAGPELIRGPANVLPFSKMGAQAGGAKVTVNNYSGAQVQARQLSDGEILVVVGQMMDQKIKTQSAGAIADRQRRST